MKIGKLPNKLLHEIVIGKIKSNRKEVLLRPGIGEDCSAIDFKKDICVLSSDPITGALNNLGTLAVNVACNDLASCGAEPVGLMVTILAPPSAKKEDIENIMDQMCTAAGLVNADIIGGHTEITDAVKRFVISTTCVGKVKKDLMVTSSGARAGDKIVLTKYAGMEGTAIIAYDMQNELSTFLDGGSISEAQKYIERISVLKEGLIAAEEGASAMHDVTEGGVFGAVWEICEASGKGAEIYPDKIPVTETTLKICRHYGIDAFKLISSGCMLITIKDPDRLIRLLAGTGVKATVIGEITEDKARKLIIKNNVREMEAPETDELYKVVIKNT
ncbi:MAG: AIR synthase family protein [Eubacteriales bacterium]|nr:AIR synthase family protein [Eubacteriales bacterium]